MDWDDLISVINDVFFLFKFLCVIIVIKLSLNVNCVRVRFLNYSIYNIKLGFFKSNEVFFKYIILKIYY